MDCCCCCPRSSTKKKKSEASNPTNEDKSDHPNQSNAETSNVNQDMETDQRNYELDNSAAIDPEIRLAPRTFTYQEMADATENFKDGHLLGEGGFGKVYKGHLRSTNEVLAIKKLNLNGVQGNSEFMVELMTLCGADHPNLVKLLGYCIEGEQRIVVYEFMPLGSLDAHLHDLTADQMPLDWNTRMKIAAGAAKGLEYLHDKLNPPIIYRDLKSANILLGEDYHPKLSDFGLAKVGPIGDKTHVSTRVIMGTEGYCAPEYASTGHLTFKSDIYSFGVTLLEIITGRKAMDDTKLSEEKNLAVWAKPLLKDETNFEQMVDPALNGMYTKSDLNKALDITALCLHDESKLRPVVSVIVEALDHLAERGYYVPTWSDGASSSRSQNAESSSRNE